MAQQLKLCVSDGEIAHEVALALTASASKPELTPSVVQVPGTSTLLLLLVRSATHCICYLSWSGGLRHLRVPTRARNDALIKLRSFLETNLGKVEAALKDEGEEEAEEVIVRTAPPPAQGLGRSGVGRPKGRCVLFEGLVFVG